MLASEASENSRRIVHSGRGGVRHDLGLQRSPDVIHATVVPVRIATGAEGIQDQVFVPNKEFVTLGGRRRGDDVELQGDLAAVGVEGQVVHILAEGVFDFAANRGKTQDDVSGDCCRR